MGQKGGPESPLEPVDVLHQGAADRDRFDQAKNYIVSELNIRPTIRGIDRLIDYLLLDHCLPHHHGMLLLLLVPRPLHQN